jgi:uncharacterized membrane protein YeaQ/YmgE (transglycosylase-associated protein family)
MVIAPVGLLFALLYPVIGAVILYWIIRLAVRHAIRDSRR